MYRVLGASCIFPNTLADLDISPVDGNVLISAFCEWWIIPSGVQCASFLFRIQRSISSTSLPIFPLWTSLTSVENGKHAFIFQNMCFPRPDCTGTSVYYKSIKRELKIRPMYECRCDERLQTKTREFTRLSNTGLVVELEHLKIETRLINATFGECDGWVCDTEVTGAPSRLRLIRKAAALARMFPHFDLSIEEKAARRKWKNPRSNCADWTPG